MEKQYLPQKTMITLEQDLSKSYVSHLYHAKNLTIKEAVEAEECDVIDYDYSNVGVVDKRNIREQVLFGNVVVMYLDVDLTEIPSTGIIKPPSYKINTAVPFVCIGWSDYEYLTSLNEQGKQIKNRGYLILCQMDELHMKEKLYYLPYKFVKSGEDEGVVREVWSFIDIHKTVIPTRSKIEMTIGENIFKDGESHYETDAVPFYHEQGNPLIPLRIVAEHLGYTVNWEKRKKIITLTKPDATVVVLKIGEKRCLVNGVEIQTHLPVYIDKCTKRSFVTLGFVRCIFGCEAEFVKSDELIKIYRNH